MLAASLSVFDPGCVKRKGRSSARNKRSSLRWSSGLVARTPARTISTRGRSI